MQCPECKVKMQEVKTSSHYGIPIVLDQCQKCGGTWFDKGELYRTKHGVAQKIDKLLNIKKLSEFSVFEKKNLICPNDSSKLKLIKDRYFPQHIQIETCQKCGGFWFNHGEFAKFQNSRIEKMKKFEGKELKKSKKVLNKALDKKIINIMKLYGSLEKDRQKEKEKDMAATVVYLTWMLLRMIFLKR